MVIFALQVARALTLNQVIVHGATDPIAEIMNGRNVKNRWSSSSLT